MDFSQKHFLTNQFKTSFLLSWIVIEKYIDNIWVNFLKSRNITGKRYSKLAESALWSADDELELLNFTDQISDNEYNQIIRLKRKRKKIIHAEENATNKEAEECIELAASLTRRKIRESCFIE